MLHLPPTSPHNPTNRPHLSCSALIETVLPFRQSMHPGLLGCGSRVCSTGKPIATKTLGRFGLLVAACACLVSLRATANAQEVSSASDFSAVWTVPEEPTINLEQCLEDQVIAVGWTLDSEPAADQQIQVFTSTSENCSTQLREITTRSAVAGDVTVNVGSESLLPDCTAVESSSRYICLRLSPTVGSDTGVTVAIEVLVDTVPPLSPDEIEVLPADNALKVDWGWSAGRPSDVRSVRVYYRLASESGDPAEMSVTGTTRTTRITGLQNGATYDVWLRAVDTVGNIGDPSETVQATPLATTGFWELYRESGGEETGGCAGASGGGVGIALLLLLGIAGSGVFGSFVRGRRAACLPLALFVVTGLFPADALARKSGDERGTWFFDVDLGPYRPDIDREFDGDGPYREVFGDGTALMARFRAERALWQGIGQLGLGVSASFARRTGEALFADGTPSPDPSSFNWMPLQLSLAYRFDYAALEWGIPLMPYLRAGLSATPWWIRGPDGVESDNQGNRALGLRPGWFYGGGIGFLMNAIDPRLAADIRRGSGVRHTYLYVDFVRMETDGFGSPGFVLSDSTWFIGLSFEI